MQVINVKCERASKDALAYGILSADREITILKGSRVSDSIAPLFYRKTGYYDLRIKLENNGVIKDRIFQRDWKAPSLSAAASVVLGTSSNGLKEWKRFFTIGENI